jgi:hypothetical protein
MMAGENETGTRTVFAAVVAFTGKPTADRRVIVAPEGFRCPARSYPLPVYGWAPFTGELNIAVQVGRIDEAYVIDGRVIVFGHLSLDDETRPFVDQLAAGTHVLEIDLGDVGMEHNAETATTTMLTWSLAAVHIGDRPCWNLPPVQIETLTGERLETGA